MAGTGLLLVFSEPGSQVTLEEFTDWYDNEHVPIRMNNLPSFLTGARYKSAPTSSTIPRSANDPGWLALYDITSTAALLEPSYTILRETRSERESSVIGRLAVLDRRTYELVADSGKVEESTGWGVGKPTRWVKTVAVEGPEGGAGDQGVGSEEDWALKLFGRAKGMEGWIRTRTYKVVDNGKVGVNVGTGEEDQYVPKYMIVHEAQSMDTLAKLAGVSSGLEVKEERDWELHKAWPSLAANGGKQ